MIKSLTKHISALQVQDPICSDQDIMGAHIVKYLEEFFSNPNLTSADPDIINSYIPNWISDDMDIMFTKVPSVTEIKTVVFSLNKVGTPGSVGFGASFYQHYWEIIYKTASIVVIQFFQYYWILSNFNYNILIIIPKTENVDSMDRSRLIALANFKFMIISKVLAERLATLMPNIISLEHKGFLQGRSIKLYWFNF